MCSLLIRLNRKRSSRSSASTSVACRCAGTKPVACSLPMKHAEVLEQFAPQRQRLAAPLRQRVCQPAGDIPAGGGPGEQVFASVRKPAPGQALGCFYSGVQQRVAVFAQSGRAAAEQQRRDPAQGAARRKFLVVDLQCAVRTATRALLDPGTISQPGGSSPAASCCAQRWRSSVNWNISLTVLALQWQDAQIGIGTGAV